MTPKQFTNYTKQVEQELKQARGNAEKALKALQQYADKIRYQRQINDDISKKLFKASQLLQTQIKQKEKVKKNGTNNKQQKKHTKNKN